MNNQASRLDNLMNLKNPKSFFDNKGNTKFIAITSGKGGVGKSNISANLAYSLDLKVATNEYLVDCMLDGFSNPNKEQA
ncbi:P-loop NTPase [Helicobacter pylori]|nr:P-loop NTPase [Helicobacter pylori]WQX51370.1 P-loop NTPase [Helicobacter pylori]